MQKSLFSRYFMVCAWIILGSMLFVGLIFLLFASSYFTEEKTNLLQKNVESAKALILTSFIIGDGQTVNEKFLPSGFHILSNATDSIIFFTDVQGKTVLCSENMPCNHTQTKVSENMLAKIDRSAANSEALYFEMGTLDNLYIEKYYTIASPVVFNNISYGYIFSSVSARSIQIFNVEILKMFLISALFVIIVAFIVIYFVTMRMTKPLTQMASAAQSFGKGNFTLRIPVERYDEIGHLAIAFNNMAASLATVENTRRSFVANVSHELKTPMTTIAGFIDGILDGTIPPEKHQYYLRIVSDEVNRLSRVVRSMLNIAKIEAGEMKIVKADIDVTAIVLSTVFTFEQKIDAKHLEVKGLDTPKIYVQADADLIHQVVYNLADNAVKFANEGGYLEVSYETQNNMVYIGIKNSGEGIPKEDIPLVFERFYKTDKSRSLDKQGVGLGLFIVKSIVNLHGGEIIVRSEEGQYTQFLFSLPAVKQPPQHKFKKNTPPLS